MSGSRLDCNKVFPEGIKAMMGLENCIHQSGLDRKLWDLVKLRASQINGCAYCVDMHFTDARKNGESERRLNLVCVWRETSLFTEKERAALAWTEAITLIAQADAPDPLYQEVVKHFTEKETAALTFAIMTINAWNRFAISFRKPLE